MKIEKLAPDKVRVFITEGDLLDMKIDAKSITPESPRLSVFLGRVLEAVKAEVGFSIDGGQVIAEATPEADGIILELYRVREPSRSAKSVKRDSILFEITGFEALCDMLKNISPAYLLNMRLYLWEDNFYVAVPKKRIPAIMYEYSLKNRRAAAAESKVAECGRLIAGGYRLMCMATALKKIN